MCLTKRLLSEPLFSVGRGVQEFNRYPSTVNRQPCSCLMQWSDRELTAFGMSHRTAPSEPLFYVGTRALSFTPHHRPIDNPACCVCEQDCCRQPAQRVHNRCALHCNVITYMYACATQIQTPLQAVTMSLRLLQCLYYLLIPDGK